MKIGIITSNNDSLLLFRFLQNYDHEYLIYYDSKLAPYGKKDGEKLLPAIISGIEYLIKQGAEKIILPPMIELLLAQKSDFDYTEQILPFFQKYLLEMVFPHSLVGKVWLLGDLGEVAVAQNFITELAQSYQLRSNQKSIKKFHFPFAYRSKSVPLWQVLLQNLSRKSFLSNSVIKHDLRYFKDANVDTIIPLNYLYFWAEKTIQRFFNPKKTKFHGLQVLNQIFQSFDLPTSQYQVTLFATDNFYAFDGEKRLLRLLGRGKEIELEKTLM